MLLPLMLYLAASVPPQDIPPYFVAFIQERTLFAQNEPVLLTVRLGNQLEGSIKAKRWPDILAGLKVTRDGVALELSPKITSNDLFKRSAVLGYGAHRDFRLNLRKYFPAIAAGGVYKISYKDAFYDVVGHNIQVAAVDMPSLDQVYVMETSLGRIVIELDEDQAANHAKNFALLVEMQFYRDMNFHRVVSGFVIQTGDPLGSGEGGSGFPMALEKSPFLKHDKYSVGMARSQDRDSATSQFYICLKKASELDEGYTAIGKVIEGFDVVDQIGAVPTTGPSGEPPDRPLKDVFLFGIEAQPRTPSPGRTQSP